MTTGELEEGPDGAQPAATSPVRRASQEDVRRMVENFLPDPELRRMALTYFADLIDAAHAVGASRWAVTVPDRERMRFVAGFYFVADIGRGAIGLALQRENILPEHLERLEQLVDWDRWKFKSYPNAVTCTIPADQFAELNPLVREASLAFTRSAAASARRVHNGSRAAHCAGALAYLRAELQRDLPEPIYELPEPVPADGLDSLRREEIEAALTTFDREVRDQASWQGWEHNNLFRYAINHDGRRYPVKEIVRLASGSTQFNSDRARRLLGRLGFLVEALYDTAQGVWLFQANQQFYNLAEQLRGITIGSEDEWQVTRFREEMKPGDQVLLWQSGPDAGIYAVGELTGAPSEHTYAADDVPGWVSAPAGQPVTVWQVPFRYTQVLPEPLRRTTLAEDPVLQRMHIMRAPSGTNFRVNSDEWAVLQELLPRVAPPSTQPGLNPRYTLAECASETGLSEPELARWLRAIERKGQAVLYGPPGTGKTFVAQRLARHLTGGSLGFVELVQFHPAYSYEDFIQGIRPQSRADGSLTYPLVPGRFLDFCARAKAVTDTCVLIIDEINRANLARVFGELMYLLEYRGDVLPLAGGGLLSIPSNVRIIGTMNTADRSIALVDHALRRRFAFLSLQPNYSVLRHFHEAQGVDAEGLIATLEQVNHEIGDPSYAIGISFFMREGLGDHIEDTECVKPHWTRN